jgi:hypothetical protein
MDQAVGHAVCRAIPCLPGRRDGQLYMYNNVSEEGASGRGCAGGEGGRNTRPIRRRSLKALKNPALSAVDVKFALTKKGLTDSAESGQFISAYFEYFL